MSESVTDVDRVLELLAQSGSLSPAERAELDRNCSSSAEKVHLLLKTLVEKKERDHFQEFCWALEKTHPVLLSALLPANNHNNTGNSHTSTGTTFTTLLQSGLLLETPQFSLLSFQLYIQRSANVI